MKRGCHLEEVHCGGRISWLTTRNKICVSKTINRSKGSRRHLGAYEATILARRRPWISWHGPKRLTDVASKPTTLVTAICRRLKTAGRAVSFRCFLPIIRVSLEKLFRGILKADGATDCKSFPSCGLLRCKAQESAFCKIIIKKKQTNKSPYLQGQLYST